MPYYEYRCEACGHELEARQRITEDPLVSCPSCGDDALKRLISATSFVLKGGGWYVTDYGGKKKSGTSDAGESPSTPESSSSSSGSGASSDTGSASSGGDASSASSSASTSGSSGSSD